jgi:hypothetical protein
LLLANAESSQTEDLQPAAGPRLAGSLVQLAPPSAGSNGDHEQLVLSSLWNVIHHYKFQLDPVFAGLNPEAPEAETLLQVSRVAGRTQDTNDQLWLNRHLLEAAFRQATGHACFRRLDSGLDGILVSDVGKPMEVQSNRRAGGLIRTAMRASDILMDRVWQLEKETFHDTPGFVFAPVTAVVDPAEDPTALHPEIQRQLANIRTDLDRFSPLEISSLVRHGYCVGRKVCRAHPDLFGADLPGNAPWDPVPAPRSAAPPGPAGAPLNGTRREPTAATVEARALQASAVRRIWSTLLSFRDWTSYVYVPLLIPILVLMPYVVVKSYQRSHRQNQLIESLSQSNRDLAVMSRLLDGPIKPWTGVAAEEDRHPEKVDLKGFEVLQDSRIIDLRNWKPGAPAKQNSDTAVYGYRRVKVLKRPESSGNNLFRVHLLATSPNAQIRFPPQKLEPKLHRVNVDSASPAEPKSHWEMSVDFHKVPAGDYMDVIYEHYSSGEFLQEGEKSTTIAFANQVDTADVTRWILMPEGKEYQSWHILRYKTGEPEKVEPVKVVQEYLAEDYTILAYKLMSVKAGYTYELTWYYK